MLRALNVSNTIVSNFLMYYKGIHRILLVEEELECKHFVERDEDMPTNCWMILDMNGNQYYAGYRVYRNPQARCARPKILKESPVKDDIG